MHGSNWEKQPFPWQASECHHSFQSGSTVLLMQFISQTPAIRKAEPIVLCGGAGWSVLFLCPETVQGGKG